MSNNTLVWNDIMGLLSHALVQVVVASVLLGALKRAGIVRYAECTRIINVFVTY